MPTLKIATWNVNGIRARGAQLSAWLDAERPDVVCLQEVKATPDQIPGLLANPEQYWSCWHGQKGYSGVALLVRRGLLAEPPPFSNPTFDFECRAVATRVGAVTIASLYVPNGGRDFEAKLQFLRDLEEHARLMAEAGALVVLCGDLNVARTEMDVHPKERKPRAIGQLPEERALIERILAHGLVDVQRALHPDDDQLFTWWAPWRNLRQRNIGWRLDYVLASAPLAARARSCVVQREVGTSDHGPVVAVFD